MKFYVYIIYNIKHEKFYVGQTYNLGKRLYEHRNGLSIYTSKYGGEWRLAYREIFNTRKEAMARERFLKKQKNRSFYIKLHKLQYQKQLAVGYPK